MFLFRGINIFTTSNPYEAYVNNLSVESGLPECLLVFILFFVDFIVSFLPGHLKDCGLNSFDFAYLIFETSPGFVISHHTGVVYSSLVILENIELGLITLLDRLYSNLGILLNTLLPSGIVITSIPQSNMSIYVKSLADTTGGVYAPLVFHVSFYPYVGPLFFGFLIGRLFSFILLYCLLNISSVLLFV